MNENERKYPLDGSYIVRMYDRFEHRWIDISQKGISLIEAAQLYDKTTNGGKEHASFKDGDYYDIFPAYTIMTLSTEILGE